ncbi:anoctamin-5 [Copidosoma floridanum]|uniref:anoctamin-5 n=1 Tax=Copidosoma floridanum TaxID=29053 RepID=UPI0006C9B896|nr:anoctamin-5 [Copidosoma floridanum]
MEKTIDLVSVSSPKLKMKELDQNADFVAHESEGSSSNNLASAYYSTRSSFRKDSVTDSEDNVFLNFAPLNGVSIIGENRTEETMPDGSFNELGRACNRNNNANTCSPVDVNTSLYFRDGIRLIDFVLVWDGYNQEASKFKFADIRKIFEDNLKHEGLQLEHERDELSGLNFIKITTPLEVLRRYSEILKLRMPMKEIQGLSVPRQNKIFQGMNSFFRRVMSKYYVDPTIFPPMKHKFTAVYSRDKEYLFDIDSPEFFTPATRSRIVQFILDRTGFSMDKKNDFAFGIQRLINEKTYTAAYPLHDGTLKTPDSMRYLLYTEWASIRKIFHYQPLDYIKEYFGVKIGLYFAWLGFYTHMLLFASIVGLLCFMYSLLTLGSDEIIQDVCKSNRTMCSQCNFCTTWNLNDTCLHSKVTYLFDNASTLFFAIFMSLWATLFLELWKNYSAEITHRWDLTSLDIHEEHPRPEYLARLSHSKKKIMNFVTNTFEPKVPFWKVKLPVTIFSFSVIMLLISVAMATVLGVVLYRMSVLTAIQAHPDEDASTSSLKVSVTAALINLGCIFVFNWIYTWLAEYLTELELPRTQTEYDDSLTLKIYLLEFINYYASIFYIAFFKGKFIGRPDAYNLIFNSRQEECSPGGCLLELCIQLSIIMIGKQIINSIFEMLLPLFYKWMNTIRVSFKKSDDTPERRWSRKHLQWVRDYKLVEWGARSLFPEYLEMILQYGFVTIFVAAFPLAPFFALINNFLEMRLDAKKLLTMYRRPVGQRVRDIGVWYRILDSVSKFSVITNAFIIAFTSNFIPRLVYRFYVSEDYSLTGFLDHSLSKFKMNSSEICYYPDYRESPDSEHPYKYTNFFWQVLVARLTFVVIFENVVAFVMIMVKWCIPDMSSNLRDKIRREAYITNEIIIQHEADRARKQTNSNEISTQRHSLNRWNRLRNSMTADDFDLEVHGSPVTPAIDSSKSEPVKF